MVPMRLLENPILRNRIELLYFLFNIIINGEIDIDFFFLMVPSSGRCFFLVNIIGFNICKDYDP